MAPDIRPTPITAPNKVVRGINNKMAVINSAMPVPIRICYGMSFIYKKTIILVQEKLPLSFSRHRVQQILNNIAELW